MTNNPQTDAHMEKPMSDEKELLPCPFCGSGDIGRIITGAICYVVCDGCGIEQMACDSEEESNKVWNTRVTNPRTLAMEGALAIIDRERTAMFYAMVGGKPNDYDIGIGKEQLTTAIASLTKALGR